MEYLSLIQNTLGVDLNRKGINGIELNPLQLRDLSEKLTDYYKTYKIASKNGNVLRPYLPPRFKLGFASLQYTFNLRDEKIYKTYALEETVKRTLLYAHEVSVQDPLPYLLDYFSLDPTDKHAQERLPIISHILTELGRLKPLIDNNILHIVSDEVFTGLNDWSLIQQANDFEDILKTHFGPNHFDSIIFEDLIKCLYEQVTLENNIDLYFPTEKFAEYLKVLFNVYKEKYITDDLKDLHRFGQLGGLELISTEKLSVNDIIAIRENNKVFQQWQLLIKETLDELQTNEGNFNDPEREFKKILKEQTQKLNLDVLKEAKKNAFWSSSDKFREKVFIGVVSFATLNFVLSEGLAPGIGSINNTIFSALLEQLFTLKPGSISKKVKRSVNQHFLTLQ